MARLRLILMRHGESPQDTPDHERTLSPRGEWDATSTGEQIKDLGWIPELVLCSTANRTKKTFSSVAFLFEPEPPLMLIPQFYGAQIGDVQTYLSFLTQASTVLLIGHNPMWSQMASILSDSKISLSTANAAMLGIEASSWKEGIESIGCWDLEHFITPRS